jgi:hypothetical protein
VRVLHPSLVLLMRLRLRAVLRRMVSRSGRGRSIVALLVGVVILGLWLLPSILAASTGHRADPEGLALFGPFVLLAVCVTTAAVPSKSPLTFTPSEVDLLFPGPFARRELVLYKLAGVAAGGALVSVLLALWIGRVAPHWWAAYAGSWLGLMFVNLVSIAIGLGFRYVARRLQGPVGWVLLLTPLALLGAWGTRVLMRVDWSNAEAVLRGFRESRFGSITLWPFAVHVNAMAAGGVGELIRWGALGLAVNTLLLAFIVRLDADYLEAAAEAGRRAAERAARVRSGATWTVSPGSRWSRLRVPLPGRLGGAGPIAWRQATAAARGSAWVVGIVLIGCAAAPPIVAGYSGVESVVVLGALIPWLAFVLPGMLRFDFRSDLDAMEMLKSLPLSPVAVAVGQVAVPAMLVSVVEWALLGSIGLTVGKHAFLLIVAAVGVLPVNILMLSVENSVFLFHPTRLVPHGPLDLQSMGRGMLLFLLRFTLLLLVGVGVGLIAWLTYWLFGSPWTAAATGWLALTGTAVGGLAAVAGTFERFDVSRDLPPA